MSQGVTGGSPGIAEFPIPGQYLFLNRPVWVGGGGGGCQKELNDFITPTKRRGVYY